MKRFTKMLALGMAVALTFGMTVSASGNDPVHGASGNDPVNPSPITSSVQGSDGVVPYPVDAEAVYAATKEAVEKDGALDSLSAGKTMDTFQFVDAFGLTVTKAGTVTYTTTRKGGWDKEYGYSWGFALIHFTDDMKVKEVLKLSKDGNSYSTGVKSGSPFAVVMWRLKASGHVLSVNKGYARATYQDEHMAARVAIENGENNGNYGTIAAQQYDPKYVFYKTMGSVVLNLPEGGKVQFSGLDNLEQGEAYVVLCYSDVQNIAGAPTWHFLMTDKVADGKYTVDLPVGEYAAVVVKVTTDATKVPPTPPVTPPEMLASPSVTVGTQAAGVVSPKTGEMLPVAVILAAVCLAGAAVCAKKARTNA